MSIVVLKLPDTKVSAKGSPAQCLGYKGAWFEKMIAFYNFVPLYCPSCDTPTRLDRMENTLIGKYQAHRK
jgi:hypothetical protein